MKTKYILLLFFLLGVLTRFPLIEKMQSHWDGPQYSIGVVSYDLTEETPAPPGYPIYIFFGWVVNQFVHNPHYSLLIVAVIFSGFTAAAFFLAGKYIFSRDVGIISALLYLSSPAYYYFGLTVYPYGLVSFFVLFISVVVYKIVLENKQYGFLLGLSFALFCGIRPQDSLNLLPLVLFGFISLIDRERIKALATFVISISFWLVPLLVIANGLQNYLSVLSNFFRDGALSPVGGVSTGENIRRVVKGLFLALGIASIALIYFPPRIVGAFQNNKLKTYVIFFTLLIVPSLLSVLFIRNDHSGYQMVYISPLLVLAAHSLEKFTRKLRLRYLIIGFVLTFNLLWFFRDRDPGFQGPYIQTSFHYSEVRKNDIEMVQKVDYIDKNFDPRSTIIIVDSQHFRPVMYHLKNFEVASFSSLETNDTRYTCYNRYGKNWHKEEIRQCSHAIDFPANVKTVIFFNNEFEKFVNLREKKVHSLSHNLILTELSVLVDKVYFVEYKNFRLDD